MYISYWTNWRHIVCGFVSTIAALASHTHTSRILCSTNQRETYDRIQPLSSWLRNLLCNAASNTMGGHICHHVPLLEDLTYYKRKGGENCIYIPAWYNGCCFNPTGWCIGTPYHAFSTPWKIIHIMIAWLHLQGVWACCLPWWIECVLKAPCLCLQRLVFFGISFAHQSERMVSIVFWNVKDAWNWQTNKFRLLRGCWFQTSRVSPNVCQCEDTFKHTCITA